MSLTVAIEILRAVNSAADVFPPLKSATGGALYIAESIEKFKKSKEDWRAFAEHIEIYVAVIMEHIPKDDSKKKDDWMRNLDTLNIELSRIKTKIEDLQSQKGVKRLRTYLSADGEIQNLQRDFDTAIRVFQFQSTLTSRSELLERLQGVSAEGIVERLLTTFKKEIVSEMDWSAAFARLPDPAGTSWNPARACLPGTRVTHLAEISSWISCDTKNPGGTAEIFLVADALGSGKTTLAHAVCERAHRDRHLVASFFFNRLDAERATPRNLFGAIIRGLCDLDTEVKKFVAQRLDADSTLALAPPSRQFQELVLPLCNILPKNRPLVIVIDALDEGCNQELLLILRDNVPLLPSTFRIVITSRPEESIMPFMSKPHIRRSGFSLSGLGSRDDVEQYINNKLRQTSWGADVTVELKNKFVERTQGLFLWAATVFNHLGKSFKPVSELQSLINDTSGYWRQGKDSEKKLDNLYDQILSKFEWSDTEFERAYRMVMGALVTLKEPMSVAGLSSLYAKMGISPEEITQICIRLCSFLAVFDANSPHQPIHLLHLSVQEYLTTRAPGPHRLDANEHHSVLASCCVETINKELVAAKIPQLGYTRGQWDGDHVPWIPRVERASISEPLWYSCFFFLDHISLITATNASLSLTQMMEKMICQRTRQLLEITASMGKVADIGAVRKWALEIPEIFDLINGDNTEDQLLASYCYDISRCLGQIGRNEEAVRVDNVAIEIYRHLEAKKGSAFKLPLAETLNYLSIHLASLGRTADALVAANESLGIIRLLAAAQPARFDASLAISLSNLSANLPHLGRHAEALVAVQEAVGIYRRLAAEKPPAFEAGLARSLNNLSKCLADFGRFAEALAANEEAIVIRRRLAAEQPHAFEPKLAKSLYNISMDLSELGRHEDALVAIEESIEIYRRLSEMQPAAFKADLAGSLHNLSRSFSRMDRHEEALTAAENAVELYRRLAATGQSARNHAGLTRALRSLSKRLITLGRHQDALKVNHEVDTILSKNQGIE